MMTTTLVPVIFGDWSEEAEAKILATLDPVGAMANGDAGVRLDNRAPIEVN